MKALTETQVDLVVGGASFSDIFLGSLEGVCGIALIPGSMCAASLVGSWLTNPVGAALSAGIIGVSGAALGMAMIIDGFQIEEAC